MRLARFPSSDGIGPVSPLLLRCSCSRLERFPSSFGIDPVRLLPPMASTVSAGRLPSSGGRLPFSARLDKRILTTRCGVPNTVIPCQLDIAVVAFQFRVAVPRSVSLAAQRALQSAMRPVFVWSGTTVVVSHGCVVCPRTSNNNWSETRRIANSIAAAPAAIPHRMGRLDEGG